MKSYEFSNANIVLAKPQSMTAEECRDITAFKGVDEQGYPFFEVGFTPTQADIAAMQVGQPIHVRVMGTSFAPISIFTTNQDGSLNPEEDDQVCQSHGDCENCTCDK